MSLLFVPADDGHGGIKERANVPGIFLFGFAHAFELGDYSRRNQDNRPDIVTADDGGLRRSLSSQLAESTVRLQSQPRYEQHDPDAIRRLQSRRRSPPSKGRESIRG